MALVGWLDGIENQTVPSNSLSATETISSVVSPLRGEKKKLSNCVDYLSCTSQNQVGSKNTSMCLVHNN